MDYEFEKERVKSEPKKTGTKVNVTFKITIGISGIITVIYMLLRVFFPDAQVTVWAERIHRTSNEIVGEASVVPDMDPKNNEITDESGGGEKFSVCETGGSVEPEYYFITNENVNFRLESNKNSTILNEIPEHTILNVIDKTTHNGYFYVNYDGREGYVFCDYVELVVSERKCAQIMKD